VQISLAQNIAESEKTEDADTRTPLMPGEAAIPRSEKAIKDPPAQRLAAMRTFFCFGV
jgi:hypothetical protein